MSHFLCKYFDIIIANNDGVDTLVHQGMSNIEQ